MDEITQTETVAGSDSPDVGGRESATQTTEQVTDIDKLRADLNRANKSDAERRVALKALQAELDALKKERADAETTSKAEQGKFQELYEAEQKQRQMLESRISEMEATIKAQELAALRRKVAADKGLPPALADRLQGETEEEISADADELVKALPRPSAPDLNGGARGGAGKGLSPQEQVGILNRYNIDPRYMEK